MLHGIAIENPNPSGNAFIEFSNLKLIHYCHYLEIFLLGGAGVLHSLLICDYFINIQYINIIFI